MDLPRSVPGGRPLPNPFPVYPVASLRDIAPDILDKTVFTDGIRAADEAVTAFVKGVRADRRHGVAIPVRGDYGTGKTHLLTFAEARLRAEWSDEPHGVTILSVPATEASFSGWYLTVVAPVLDKLDLPRLFGHLLAAAACEIADQVLLTENVAAAIRANPLEVYPVLQEGLLSATHVERAFLRRIAAIAPRATEELQTVMAALAWPARQATAARWIAGQSLDAAERALLDVTRDLDAPAEAATILVALAGAAAMSGGVFALVIDEFEHMMAEDERTGTLRNATAIKRLLEGMVSAGALVLVAGHWKAWEQLPDFEARFGNQSTIDLVKLSGMEIGKLACSFAPDWGQRLDDAALEAIAKAGGNNIRRVMSILHQLHADTADPVDPAHSIDAAAAATALEARRRLDRASGKPDVILEEAILAAGGQANRDELLLGRLRFDLVGRRGDEICLLADVRHVTTTAELITLCNDFSIGIKGIRARYPAASGLLVVTGAVDPAALALLDAVQGVVALPGEGAGWERSLTQAVTNAFAPAPDASAPMDEARLVQEDVARDTLREVRIAHQAAAEITRSRVEEIDFGSDDRSAATNVIARESAPLPPRSSYGEAAEIIDSFSTDMQLQSPTILRFIFRLDIAPLFLFMLISFGTIATFTVSGDWLFRIFYPFQRLTVIAIVALVFLTIVSGWVVALRYNLELQAFVRYRRWGRQKLEEMLIYGRPAQDLIRVKNRLVDAPDAAGGFRRAFRDANEDLPEMFRDRLPSSSPAHRDSE